MLKNRIFYLVLLVIVVLIYILTNTYYTLMLLVMSILLPLVSQVLMLFSERGLDIALQVPVTTEKKDAAIKYVFHNRSRMPVARIVFTIRMENQMTGASSERKAALSIGGRDTAEIELKLTDCKAGTVTISTERIRMYDAFGLFVAKEKDIPGQDMIVYPNVRDIEVYMEQSVEIYGDGSRYLPDKPGNDVSEVLDMRAYVPGDEIRRIHWKLSSKTDKLMVRDFSRPLNFSVFLLIELNYGSEDMVDAQVETGLAISRGLMENGVNHDMGWFDAAEEVFHVSEVSDMGEMDMAAAQLLSSYASERRGCALEYYMTGGYRRRENVLLYVTTSLDVDALAELETMQKMQTILIYEDEEVAEEARVLDNIRTISVRELEKSLPDIVV